MKKIVSLALIVATLLIWMTPALAEGAPMWYDEAVEAVTSAGIMTGTPNGFEPEGTVTRATVFQTLYNLEGRPEVTGSVATWSDAQGKWYEAAARWAQQTGLAQGTGGGFEGDRAVTRAEIVTILSRYAQHRGVDVSGYADVELLHAYVDAELLNTWSADPFRWAVGTGVVSGKTGQAGTYLAPGDSATRAELAQILVNYIQLFP